MAEVTLATTSQKQVFRRQGFVEYVRESRFLPYTGPGAAQTSDPSAAALPIIQVISDLETGAGNLVHMPIFTRLKGQGVSGGQLLIGNEDELNNYDFTVATDWLRNGLVVPKSVSYKTEIDLWGYGRRGLRTWLAEKLRDNLIQGMGSVPFTTTANDPVTGAVGVGPDGAVYFNNATTTQKNNYVTNNSDRMLFGSAISNLVSGNMASSLGNIDTTNDRGSVAMFELAKRIAMLAGTTTGSNLPHIRPYMVPKMGREFFVAFCGPNTFRDVSNDTAMVQANRDARPRENGWKDNPLFSDGDLLKDGIIYVLFPELAQLQLNGVGAATSNVEMNFLCGSQALALAYSEMMSYKTDLLYDYQFRPRVGVQECRGQRKLSFNGTMLGVVPVFASSVADA